MTRSQHPDIDLVGTIRPGLDILANEIVIALKKRTRFCRNAPIYAPGLVVDDAQVTLLQHQLAGNERLHAELGRYTYAAQDSFTDVSNVRPIINRQIPQSPLKPMPSGVGNQIIDFYLNWIDVACPDGDEVNTYGETVDTDVVALIAIMERVNLGKAVAEAKFLDLQEEFISTKGDRDAMLQYIVHSDREAQVLKMAERLGEHYDIAAEYIVSVFEFMIATTIDIEVNYLKLRITQETVRQRSAP